MPVVPSTPPRVPVAPSSPPGSPGTPSSPTSYRDAAKSSVSSHAQGLTIKFKRATPISGVLTATQTSDPAGSELTTSLQPSTGAEPAQEQQELLVGSEEVRRSLLATYLLVDSPQGARADLSSLRLLQVPELQVLFATMEPNIPKIKRKDGVLCVARCTVHFYHNLGQISLRPSLPPPGSHAFLSQPSRVSLRR